ncbi:MAG: RNA 2',3'-cyclic phosphodiesterase [Candidatus Aenigmatarchaeota archaeon]|nr:MAG: RNA 2',3'-cyclic phosphodiesterase [Candidatus Aenigmarchaeota archaeon]
MRLFIALDITEDIRERACEIIEDLKSTGCDAKFTEKENLHMTLKFLGEVREEDVKAIENATENAIKGIEPFMLSVEGMGYFGNPKNIQTLWINTKEGREVLMKLAKRLNFALDHIRHEGREPKPHLTLGRIRSGRNRDKLLEAIDKNKDLKLGNMEVNEIKLKKSVLSNEGPTYTDLKAFTLR